MRKPFDVFVELIEARIDYFIATKLKIEFWMKIFPLHSAKVEDAGFNSATIISCLSHSVSLKKNP